VRSAEDGGGLLVVAGESSGDTHAAEVVAALRRLRPGLEAFGLGSQRCAEAGVELLADSSEIAVVGITEVLKILGRAREIYRALLDEVDRRGTRTALLIDFPDFNLRLAKALKKRGVRVVYYVSPQVWAWRQGRVRTIAKVVDEMLVLFPFEFEFYRRHGVHATHVGHPLVDQVPVLERHEGSSPLSLCLLPGSRRSEVRMHLPVMARAVEILARRFDLRASWVVAAGLDAAEFAPLLPTGLQLDRVHEDRFRVMADADLALCASGTATLEVGLLGTPMVVVYKVSRLTSWIGRILLVDLPHISLVNLVLQKGVVPEVLQEEATPGRIAAAAADLLNDHERRHNMSKELSALRGLLGERGASERAAAIVDRVLAG
jgi:lipid-A-disaccharide synthase